MQRMKLYGTVLDKKQARVCTKKKKKKISKKSSLGNS